MDKSYFWEYNSIIGLVTRISEMSNNEIEKQREKMGETIRSIEQAMAWFKLEMLEDELDWSAKIWSCSRLELIDMIEDESPTLAAWIKERLGIE